MKLSQLIELTLNEIAMGVRSAKEKSWETMCIAPARVDGKVVAEITYVEFDLSVAVDETKSETSGKEKGIGGELRVLSIGASAKSGSNNSATDASSAKLSQKIAFKVPVCMGPDYRPRNDEQ